MTTDTPAVELADRTVAVRPPTDGQFLVLVRTIELLQRENVPVSVKMKSFTQVDRVISSLIVDDDDRQFVDDLIIDGKLTLAGLMREVLSATGHSVDGGAAKAPKAKAVTRGRPRKRA